LIRFKFSHSFTQGQAVAIDGKDGTGYSVKASVRVSDDGCTMKGQFSIASVMVEL
jgi:hypothetical protein